MWFKHRAWVPIAWLLSLGNVVAVWFAAQPAEPWHATTHAVLAVGFALGARHLSARRRSPGSYGQVPGTTGEQVELRQAVAQNELLQETVDGLQPRLQELEERLDFAERMLAQRREADRPGAPPR